MEGTVTRTYRIHRETAERLNVLADDLLLVNRSELLDLLLIEALDRVQSGDWEILTQPARARLAGLRVKPY